MRKGLAYGILFVVSTAIAVTHFQGVINSWYWHYWWLDIIMHFAGGFLVGGIAFIFLRDLYGFSGVSFFRIAVLSAAATLFVGGVWEIFEVLAGATYIYFEPYWLDTAEDLVLDTAGSFVAAMVFHRLIKPTRTTS